MDIPRDWTVFTSPCAWELLFRFGVDEDSAGWYRLTNGGTLVPMPLGARASWCISSPDGSHGLLLGHTSDYDDVGGRALRPILLGIVNFRSGVTTSTYLEVDGHLAWSNDGMRFAYSQSSAATDGNANASILGIRDIHAHRLAETDTSTIRSLRWAPGDRELLAVLAQQDQLSLARFAVGGLARLTQLPLPIERTAEGISISSDGEFLSYCGFVPTEDPWLEEDFVVRSFRVSNGEHTVVSAQSLGTDPTWSPIGARLAVTGHKDGDPGSYPIVAIFDARTGAKRDIASINTGILSGLILGPPPAWSLNGDRLSFVSYENDGSAIYVAEVSTGAPAKVLQTRGLLHALAFVNLAD
jgi:hypothetical protein